MFLNQNSGYGQAQIGGIPFTTGKVFLVADSNNSNINNIDYLFKPDEEGVQRRYSTIDAAVGACTANNGDIILVAPGHAEDIDAATDLVVDVAGVQIIGLGSGNLRPTLTFTGTAGSIELDAANVALKNIILKSSITAVVVGVNVDADGIVLEDLEFTFDATGDDFITMVDVDGVNNITIKNCKFIAEDTAGCDEAIRLDDCDDVTIEGNVIYGDFTDGAIIGEGAAGKNLQILRNSIYNSDTTAGFVVDLNVAFTGILAHNSCGTLFATAPETALDPGSLLSIENYVCNAVDESGALVPTTVST